MKFKSVMKVVAFLIGFLGVIICACETEIIEQQITNAVIGLGMLGVAGVIGCISERGGKRVR